jgi:hypothetical protein
VASINRAKLEVLMQKARALREVWLRERKERLAIQLAANAELRRRWMESDLIAVHVTQSKEKK